MNGYRILGYRILGYRIQIICDQHLLCVCAQLIDADIPLNEQGTGFAPFFVRMLLQYDILDKMEAIQTVSMMASKEYSLEKVSGCKTKLEK